MVFVGFDKQCITPDLPVSLSGYAGTRIAAEVHDDLYARCIAMQCEEERFLLAQCDCIAVDESLRQAVLHQLKDLGLPDEHFILAASHTHSGPAGTIDTSKPPFASLQGVFGAPNPEYQKQLAKKIALAAKNAFADLDACQLTIGQGEVHGVGTERHSPEFPGDPSLLVFLFQRNDGKRALLYNYSCHPTVLNPENLLITADFPYAAEQQLPFDLTMFINGNAGDISTRFTRKSSTYEQAEVYGTQIADCILQALSKPVFQGSFDTLRMKQYPVTLPVKKMPPKDLLLEELKSYEQQLAEGILANADPAALRILASYVEGAKVELELSEAIEGLEKLQTHFTILTLQDLKIATIPGELFCTLGRLLKQQGIQVFGYSNGYFMYLADEAAYEKKYYEAMSSPFEKGTGEVLVQKILECATD